MASHLNAHLVKLVMWLLLTEGGTESFGLSIDPPDCTHSTGQEAKFMDHKVSIVNMSWDSLCSALDAIWQQKSSLLVEYKGGNEYEDVL